MFFTIECRGYSAIASVPLSHSISDAPSMKLRIATWNIHKGVSTIGTRPRVHGIKQAITTMAPDILFLQEVQGRHDLLALRHAGKWPTQAQHEFLAGDTHHAAYGMNAVYDHGHHGNALLSRFPIESMFNHDVSDHAFESRGILHCVLPMSEVSIHCYVVHLGLFAGSRLRQTEALIEAVTSSAPEGAPLLIAGDFNDWGARLRPAMAAMGLHDAAAPRAATYPARLPIAQLDYAYARGLTPLGVQVPRGLAWWRMSDHLPLIAEFGF